MAEIRNLTRNGETFYPLTTSSAVINEATGEGMVIDDEPIAMSNNLVKSGGVKKEIDSINMKIDGNISSNHTPSNGVTTIKTGIQIKAGRKYSLQVSSNGSTSASSMLGFYLVDEATNINIAEVYPLSSAGTWDGSLKSVSFIASSNTTAKITSYGSGVTSASEVRINLYDSNNLIANIDRFENIVIPQYLSKEQLIAKVSSVVYSINKIPLVSGKRYRLSIELSNPLQTEGTFGIEDNVLSKNIGVNKQSDTVEFTYNGSYQEKRMFFWSASYSDTLYVSVVEITEDELSSKIDDVEVNMVGGSYTKTGSYTAGNMVLLIIQKNILKNRVVRLRADALSGLHALYGITYIDETHTQGFYYGGFAELYAEKEVKEMFVYVSAAENTYSGDVELLAQICSADGGNDGLIYDKQYTQITNQVVEIKNIVDIKRGHTYAIYASSDINVPVYFYIDNNGTNLLDVLGNLTPTEIKVGEYTADTDYTPRLTSWRNSAGEDATINYRFVDITQYKKALWERLEHLEGETARNGKLSASTIYVAPSNASIIDKMGADYVCDGLNDEVEINQAIEDVGRCGTVVLLGGEFFIDAFTNYTDFGYCGIVVKNYNNEWSRSVKIQGIRHYYNGTKITVRQVAIDEVPSDETINVFNTLSTVNIDRRYSSWYVSLQDLFINIPCHDRKCVIVNLENAGCGEIKNLRISAFGPSEAPENGSGTTREEKMAFNDELVGIRSFHGWTYGDTVRMDNISVWGCGEAFQLGGEHLIACNLRARINKCGYSFGRYGLNSVYGSFDHPNTLINCCDEASIYGPRFVFCGLMDTHIKQQYPSVPDKKLQCYTFIDFNCEQFEIPAEETEPGTFCGTIQFSSGDGTFGNFVTTQFWKNDGSGKLFRTINSSHALGGTTALRNTYTPQYMQQYYDETLSKLLIYDGTNWVDSDGNIIN